MNILKVHDPNKSFIITYNYIIKSKILSDAELRLFQILLTYADKGKQSFPSMKLLAKDIGKSRRQVITIIQNLKDKGVIGVEKRYTKKGDPESNLYTLYLDEHLFNPEKKESLACDTDQSTQQSNLKNSYSTNTDDTAKQKKSQYTSLAFTREMLNDIYDFEIMKNDSPEYTDLLDSFIEIILETLNSNSETIRVNKQDMSIEAVKSRLIKLRYPHLVYVADEISKLTEIIKNKRAYIITSLYNSYTTIELHYTNKVNHDINNY